MGLSGFAKRFNALIYNRLIVFSSGWPPSERPPQRSRRRRASLYEYEIKLVFVMIFAVLFKREVCTEKITLKCPF